jgi:hypothetical protein
MSHEVPVVLLQPSGPVEDFVPPPPPAQPIEAPATPSPEQVRAVEAVFAQQDKESATVATFLGMYTSAVMLHNLAVDTFTSETKDPKAKPRLKPEDEPEE